VLYPDAEVLKAAVIDLQTNEPRHILVDEIEAVTLTGRRFHPDRRIDLHHRRFRNAFTKIGKR
jgi:hypothetical protein